MSVRGQALPEGLEWWVFPVLFARAGHGSQDLSHCASQNQDNWGAWNGVISCRQGWRGSEGVGKKQQGPLVPPGPYQLLSQQSIHFWATLCCLCSHSFCSLDKFFFSCSLVKNEEWSDPKLITAYGKKRHQIPGELTRFLPSENLFLFAKVTAFLLRHNLHTFLPLLNKQHHTSCCISCVLWRPGHHR